MSPYSPSWHGRGALLIGALGIGGPLFLAACAGTDPEQDTHVAAGDLTGFDVDIHEAVG